MDDITMFRKLNTIPSEKSKMSSMSLQSWGADFSYVELMDLFNETINNGLERNYIWDEIKAENYIQSILLGIPLTGLYFIVFNNFKLFVDGYQRIATLYQLTQWNQRVSLRNNKAKPYFERIFSNLNHDDQGKILNLSLHGLVLSVHDTCTAVDVIKRIRYLDYHFTNSDIELYMNKILVNC